MAIARQSSPLVEMPLFLADRNRDAGNLDIDRAEVVTAGEIEDFPVGAAKGQIRRGRSAVHDAAELFALRVHDPQPASATAINIALDVDLHAVRNAGLVAAQIDKN